MCLHLVREIDLFFLCCILIYEGEKPIFQKRGEVSEKEREEREQRNKKREKIKVERGIWSF